MKRKVYPIWGYIWKRTAYSQPEWSHFYSKQEAQEHARVFQSHRYNKDVLIIHEGCFTRKNAIKMTGKEPERCANCKWASLTFKDEWNVFCYDQRKMMKFTCCCENWEESNYEK